MSKIVPCSKCHSLNRVPIDRIASQQPVCSRCQTVLHPREVQKISYKHLQSILAKGSQLIVIDAYADWCGPCKSYAPIFQSLAHQEFGRADFFKIDTDAESQFSQQYGIRGIPATLFFRQGQLVHSQPGLLSELELKRLVIQFSQT